MFPTGYASSGEEYISKGKALHAQLAAEGFADGRVTLSWAPHAPYTVTDAQWLELKQLADEMGCTIHTHLHETAAEVECSCKLDTTSPQGMVRPCLLRLYWLVCRDVHSIWFKPSYLCLRGVPELLVCLPARLHFLLPFIQMACHKSDQAMSPFLNFQRMKLLTSSLIAAHMTTLTPDEIALCGVENVNIAHCPTSNLKLASGFCPVAKLREAGANVTIGTDGTCSNNTLDMFAEMKLACVLAKGVASDAAAVPALEAIRMATINGAKALGLESKIGSVVAGKDADLIAINLSEIESIPMYSVISHVVFSTTRDQVTDVWVAGKQLLKSRQLTTIDEVAVKEQALVWQAKVSTPDPDTPAE